MNRSQYFLFRGFFSPLYIYIGKGKPHFLQQMSRSIFKGGLKLIKTASSPFTREGQDKEKKAPTQKYEPYRAHTKEGTVFFSAMGSVLAMAAF
jgi:hypothetical protein